MKHLALTITTTLATLAVILIVWQLHSIVLLFLFSLLIAATLRNPLESLIQRGLRRWLAVLLVYGLIVVGVGLGLGLLAMPLAHELDLLTHALVRFYERGYGFVQGGIGADSALLNRLPSSADVGQLLLEGQPATWVRHILGFTQGFAFFIGQAILALVLSIYWTVDRLHFERLWLSLLEPSQRTWTRELWYKLEENVGAYIQSEILQSILAGALFTLGFWLLGLTYPFLLAVIGAIAWFIPVVGALFAVPLIVIITLFDGVTLAVMAALYTILIFGVMEFVVEPRLYDRSKYGVILVILVMLAMVDALGLIGLLLAPPLALTLQIILDELLSTPAAPPPTTVITLHDLQEQFVQVHSTIKSAETLPPRVKNMADRLEELLQKTQETTV
jgi:putative permease